MTSQLSIIRDKSKIAGRILIKLKWDHMSPLLNKKRMFKIGKPSKKL